MDAIARDFVRQRAGDRCEYCRLQQQFSRLIHHVELHKGPNLTGIDPQTQTIAPLFHPRRDHWAEHFVFDGLRIEGISATGRATVQVLAMNDTRRIEMREEIRKHSP